MAGKTIVTGNAVAASGGLERPDRISIPAQAPSCRASSGGIASAKIRETSFGADFSFASAVTRVYSTTERDQIKVVTSSEIKKIVIAKRLTADLISCSLMSTHFVHEGAPAIVPLIQLVNLRLDGFPVYVLFNVDLFTAVGTKGKFESYLAPGASRSRQRPTGDSEFITTTVVREIRTEHPNAIVDGHVIRLPGFGYIYLAEFSIESWRRRLTMLRVNSVLRSREKSCSRTLKAAGGFARDAK